MRSRWAFIGLLLFLVLLVFSCTTSLEQDYEIQNETDVELEGNLSLQDVCEEQWRCLGDEIKAFQFANCSFGQRLDCPRGCINDSCRAAEVCEVGFKCVDENRKGYQLESCSWISKSVCEFGCREGECQDMPENVTEELETEEEISEENLASSPATTSLTLGETHTITINENEYNLSIYTMDIDAVRIQLNSEKSDWINSGGNYTYQQDVLFIDEVLFQPYEGGLREIGYRIG